MRRLSIVAGLGALVYLAIPTVPAVACTCALSPASAQVSTSDLVFSGTVLSVRSEADLQRATFKVMSVYKGSIGEHVEVSSASTADACGIQFAAENTYLIFAGRSGDAYTTSLCSGTTDDLTLLERAGYSGQSVDVEAIAAATTPAPQPEPAGRTGLIAVATAAVAAVFVAHARRFTRA
jgi:hypothetical protein